MPDCSHFRFVGWSAETLERLLANPLQAVPGTAMGYAGVTDRTERADLIACIEQAKRVASVPKTATHAAVVSAEIFLNITLRSRPCTTDAGPIARKGQT